MTRQHDVKAEVREATKRDLLVTILEYGLKGSLGHQGTHLKGFSMTVRDYDCFLVIRGERAGRHEVAYVGSDTMINCFVKAYGAAGRGGLKWELDKFHKSNL